ncbi:isoleucine--tRNA ligase [Dethiobacter alkaliphilus]|uniref:Isoleucine--tRNA ligase n=1 Tax=Dethiobacter alkaliphilus AHT 1 TaxID=555088 RepID=C0GJQ6_DETAL|nr:isoleucine--tRNA ligase [Dethiobacter alkaliphilus]EEG76478.1 isoleucyl-tRNA synthetase [Dethiobacter alkaliphilus AHT 1]
MEEKDYGKTLNLPKTDFPMRAGLPKREPEFLEQWEKTDIYQKVRNSRQGKEKYVLHDGPPYANGDIHMGHALNKVLKDIIVKHKSMSGFDSPYVPGWDTHGLPIEHQVVKKGKVKRNEVTPLEFRRHCRDYALRFLDIQREQFKRLGVRGDWDNPYVTLKPEFEARQIEVFGEMANKGYIYKGLKPVHWCPQCETALAEAEIEYAEHKSPSIYVRFNVTDAKGKIADPENVWFVIWTTTPWTIPANLAISLHPDFTYVRVRTPKHGDLILAEELFGDVMETFEITGYEVVAKYKGKELEGIVCKHPLYDRESVVVLGEHVTLEAGTGCVHTAPGHGQEDYEVGLRYGLDIFAPMDHAGRFTQEAGPFAGLHYNEGNKRVSQALEEEGALLSLSFLKHPYPHCWRCKEPVLFRATEQWFASVEGFRKQALEAIKDVKWIPAWGEERIHNMIVDRHDWCISRQRVWGVPIPIFYCTSCNKELINKETIKAVSELFAKEGSDAWFAREANEILPAGTTCGCGHNEFRKESDIMDVWFDSGSTHVAVLETNPDLTSPADLYLEGSDQYRGWFQSSLLTSVATRDRAPYKSTLTHGWVVDGEGKKMSKSLGNVVAPEHIIKQYGADILRLWVSSTDFRSDVRVSQDILKQLAEVYRKIRNTIRYMLGNCHDFNPQAHALSYDALDELDRYALHRLQVLVERVSGAYDDFEFHVVFHAIHNFCVIEMSNFYMDVLKDRLYTSPAASPGRRSAQTVMHEILVTLTKLIAPVLTFTSEEVWGYLPGEKEESVQLSNWPQSRPEYKDEELANRWQKLLDYRDVVTRRLEEARKEKLIGASLSAALDLYPDEEAFAALAPFKDRLPEIFIVSACTLHEPTGNKGLDVKVSTAAGEKCERCWMIHPGVGDSAEHPTLCPRCSGVL